MFQTRVSRRIKKYIYIENYKVFTSERRFAGGDIEICKYDRLLLVFTLVVTYNRSALKMIFWFELSW